MANNQYVNKVQYGNSTLIDLTGDTVTAASLAQGYTAHDASGASITGTAKLGSAYQDQDGYIVLDESASDAPQGTLSITSNGSYNVADYAGANVDIPVGMSETDLKNFITRSSTFTDIDWPSGLTSIGSYAFAQCVYLDPENNLPDEVSIIRDYAFYQCNNLRFTALPSSLETIGNNAFQNCSRLSLTSLPSGVTSIGSNAFTNCASISLTSLPSGVTTIGSTAFSGCSSVQISSLPSGVTVLNTYLFRNCTGITSFSIHSGVTKIDSYAFSGCTNLVISTLPSSLTYIGSGSFEKCTSIETISCSGRITTLTTSAFSGSSTAPMTITSASFPNMALTSTLGTAFGSTIAANACQLLEFCDIGSTTGIASNAFANCYALETLVLRKTASVCSLAAANAFTNTPMSGYNNKTGTVYVPSALISSYQTATNWSTLYNNGTVTFSAIEGSDYELE